MDTLDRYLGSLLGLACGDALGTTLEFTTPGTFTPIEDMVGGGPFGLQPGEWTDDTSMALCLADSLIACQGFDPLDQMERYLRWWRDGYLSSIGYAFDVGSATRAALARFERTREPFCGSTDPHHAGNGSLMRLAPVPMAFARRPAEAIARCADSSRTTHATTTAVDACHYFGGLLVGALNGVDRETLLSECYTPVAGEWETQPLHAEVVEVACGSFKTRRPPDIQGSGYVVRSLEAALWAFHHSTSFREGNLLAANLGDDADSTAAVYGQLAGAFYGASAIPQEWRERLALRETIETFAGQLLALAERLGAPASGL